MTAYDWSRVSRETLERLARATDCHGPEGSALRAARAEALVGRTRAEVDREIGAIVRDYVRDVGAENAFGTMSRDRSRLLRLVAEPLDLPPVIDCEFPEAAEACSCEESERLKARIAELEDKGYRATALLIEAQQQASTAEARVRELEMALENAQASARGRGERVLDAESALRALRERIEKAVAVLSTGQCRNCCPEALRFLRD